MRGLIMHKKFLLAALDQACLGRGLCAPNPSVGAVAVQYGKIIARSWHRGAGTPHAEVLLLEQLPTDCSNVTIYVTLEPCNHWGRTPPCVDAIIKKGIKQVVYGYSDPNPVVSANNTPVLLSQQGISVLHHPLPEIEQFYQSYRYWTVTKKPWVTVKIAHTFDGRIAGPKGQRVSLSNALCYEFTHQNRLHSDIILTTAKTINQDEPLLTVRLPAIKQMKPLAIIDSQLKLNPNATILTQGGTRHIYHIVSNSTYSDNSTCSYHLMPSSSEQVDLNAVIDDLGQLGYHDVWVEAGQGLFNALHHASLVNRTYIYLVPRVLGGASMMAYQDEDIFNKPHTLKWYAMEDNMIAQFDWQEDVCLLD